MGEVSNSSNIGSPPSLLPTITEMRDEINAQCTHPMTMMYINAWQP